MRYGRPVADLIRARRSTRTYTGGPIEEGTMRALAEACASLSNGLFGEKVRFKLVEKPFRKDQMVSLGDY